MLKVVVENGEWENHAPSALGTWLLAIISGGSSQKAQCPSISSPSQYSHHTHNLWISFSMTAACDFPGQVFNIPTLLQENNTWPLKLHSCSLRHKLVFHCCHQRLSQTDLVNSWPRCPNRSSSRWLEWASLSTKMGFPPPGVQCAPQAQGFECLVPSWCSYFKRSLCTRV